MTAANPDLPLAGVRIVEVSSFVAIPLAGMTLAQLGAEVIRVDPIGGAADYRRWPLAESGDSIYWAGLNKGKKSVAVDMRSPRGQQIVQSLIRDCGILLTNVTGRQWLSYDELSPQRPDLIHLEVIGSANGSTGVDYTVNAATGIPLVTGPVDHQGPINHVLPAWDISCGLYAALATVTALRRRDESGLGSQIRLPLQDVALATVANLGFLTEVMINGRQRPRLGNSIYGQFGATFTSDDGVAFMVVALTARHMRDLAALTGTTKAVAAIAEALGVNFDDEGDRYRHHDVLVGLFAPWFERHSSAEISRRLASNSVLWSRYLSFGELAQDPLVTENTMFTMLDQPRIGRHLAPGLPISIDGQHIPPQPAPALGENTAAVLAGLLALDADEVSALIEAGTVA